MTSQKVKKELTDFIENCARIEQGNSINVVLATMEILDKLDELSEVTLILLRKYGVVKKVAETMLLDNRTHSTRSVNDVVSNMKLNKVQSVLVELLNNNYINSNFCNEIYRQTHGEA